MAIKEKPSPEFEWTAEDEIQLFFALDGLKPVGVNKHFNMACIVERLSHRLNREITSEAIWQKLRTMYNLKILDEMESLPFPNENEDFSLPESVFPAIKQREMEEVKVENVGGGGGSSSSSGSGSSTVTVKAAGGTTPAAANLSPAAESKKSSSRPSSTAPEDVRRTPVPKRTRSSLENSNSSSPSPVPQSTGKRRRI